MTDPIRWRNGVFLAFFAMGFGFAAWIARTPHVRDTLDVSTDQMGLILLGIAVGSVTGLSAAGQILHRIGSRVPALFIVVVNFGLVIAALGVTLGSIPLVVVGFVLTGLTTGLTDVAMNVQGARNERAVGKPIMPVFHAFFSFGTVFGAAFGALAAWLRLDFLLQSVVVLVLMGIAAVVSFRRLEPDEEIEEGEHVTLAERLRVWRDPATIVLGLLVLGMALAEGSANDWLTLLMVDGHGFSDVGGALAFTLFLIAMTVGRLAGVPLLERFGRVPVLRASAISAIVGLVLVIFVNNQAVAIVGTAFWGIGVALGFPVGMSAAADDPRLATARVSTVATIGYFAFLAGPPLLGFLGHEYGLRNAMIFVLVLVVLSGLLVPAAREGRTAKGAGR